MAVSRAVGKKDNKSLFFLKEDSRFLFFTFLCNCGHLPCPLQNQHHLLYLVHSGVDGFMFTEAAILLLHMSRSLPWQTVRPQRTLLCLLLKCNSQEIVQAINYSQTLSLLQAEWS